MSTGTGTYNPRALDGFPKKNKFYLKEGSNIYRVLPPFGTLKKDGVIAKYWAVFWLASTKKNRKGEDVSFPVPSILQVTKDKKVITPDPVHDKIESLKKNLEAMKASNSHPEAVITALSKRLEKMRIDKSYYLNVIDPTGAIGVLKIKYTGFQALKEKLRYLETLGIDPINVGTGVFFDFKKGIDDKGKTVYTVDIHQKTSRDPQTGGFKTEIVEAKIDQSVLDRMEKEAFDLSTLYIVRTPEEQAMAASLDPAVIDRLFARPEDSEEEDAQVYADDEEMKAPTTNVLASASQSFSQVTTTPPAVTVTNQASVPTPQSVVTPPVSNTAANTDFNDYVKRFLNSGTPAN